ncbi:FeoA family protein [Pseudobacillus badius]|uniref:FeoA family protein n=1 Tax=Bacillus badius TaxID=1455 RepID=UPI003CE8412A
MVLSELGRGEKAKIVDLFNIDQMVKRRLLDFGIMEGIEVQLKQRMPFKGPFMLDYCGQCLGIRHQEAARIEIKRV